MNKRSIMKCSLTVTGILFLIFDGKTALVAAQDAIPLCLYTVLPSLFPFVTLSFLLNNYLLGKKIFFLRPLCKLCGVPSGGESLLLLGLIGGYPIGAQAAADARRSGNITDRTYRHLLGFCNNAGPSFIFGLVASQFSRMILPWAIWGVHITSAVITGIILPKSRNSICDIPNRTGATLTQSLHNAIKIMAKICGWVIIFRVFMAYIHKLLLNWMPLEYSTLLIGFLELTNGCVNLSTISSEGHRFIAAACMLNFGGLCVSMQTMSVCEGLGTGLYFPGKVLQTFIGLILSIMVLPILFSPQLQKESIILIISAATLLILVVCYIKKWWQFRQESYIMKIAH